LGPHGATILAAGLLNRPDIISPGSVVVQGRSSLSLDSLVSEPCPLVASTPVREDIIFTLWLE
jgi:hypothetical protein